MELKKIKSNIKKSQSDFHAVKEISKFLRDIEDIKKSQKIIYFSRIMHMQVFDVTGMRVGRIKDLAISGGDRFPEVSHLLLHRRRKDIVIPWKQVKTFNTCIILDRPFSSVEKRAAKDDDIFLNDHIMDKQVVDVNGLKVIRVNDISLTHVQNRLSVISIDIGSRAIFRRLGIEKILSIIPFKVSDRPVPWDTVEPLTHSLEKIHLKVPCPRVSDLHPADVAQLFDELSTIERDTLLKPMRSDRAARILLECDPEVQESIIKNLKHKRLALILEKMSPNDAANLITDHCKDRIDILLKAMNKNRASQIQEMFLYAKGSVARYMDSEFIALPQGMTIEEALAHIRSLPTHPKLFDGIYVVDDDYVFVGILSLKNFILASPQETLGSAMIPGTLSVEVNYPIELVEEIITKYDLLSIPVIDGNGRIRGIIHIEEILDVVLDRNQKNESFEATAEQKEELRENTRLKRYYTTLSKDINKLMRELESVKPRKSEYIGSVDAVKKDLAQAPE